MDIRILGWGYENIRRFGKLDIDLTQGNNTLPHVTLVMMRNGTGKTTTIHLIRSVLNGCATNWTAQQVREFRPKEYAAAIGKFYFKIRFNMDVYYYVLTFDYESGTASYETSRVSNTSGGLEPGRNLPTSLSGVFDVEEFVNRFIFDGEQAKKTLNSSSTEAENAIKYLYRVDRIDSLISKIRTLVSRKQAEEARGASQQSVKNNRTRMENKHRKVEELTQQLTDVEAKLNIASADKITLEARRSELLLSNDRIRSQVEELKEKQARHQADLIGSFGNIKARMREPYRVHPVFDEMLRSLADNMHTLKLPKTTAREFFKELSEKSHCICGRPIGPREKASILINAEEYLGEEDLVAINAIKDRIRNYSISDELASALESMTQTKDALDEIAGALERLSLQLDGDALRETQEIERKLAALSVQISSLEKQRDLLRAPAGAPGATDQNNIALAKKAYEDAKANYNIALGTYEYTQRADILINYLKAIRALTLAKLKRTIVEKTNDRIAQIVTDERIVIEKIDGNLVIEGRSGVSEGQTLAIAYAYICSLFEHSSYEFPFVVDSPAASMDLDVRREVAAAIPQLFKQLVIFVTSGEVAGFAEKMYSLDNVLFITVEGEHQDAPAKYTIGQEYFSSYQCEEEEE